jgi:hypothetical protein
VRTDSPATSALRAIRHIRVAPYVGIGPLGLGGGLAPLAPYRRRRRAAATANVAPDGLVPQMDATRDAVLVRGGPDVWREVEGEVPRIATAQIQHIVVEERLDGLDHLQDTPVPLLLPVPMQRLVSSVLVIRLTIVERVMRELQVWRQPSLREYGAANAGP